MLRLGYWRWRMSQAKARRERDRSLKRIRAREEWLERCRAKVREHDALDRELHPQFVQSFPQDIDRRHHLLLLLGDYHEWEREEMKRLQWHIDDLRRRLRARDGGLDARLEEV